MKVDIVSENHAILNADTGEYLISYGKFVAARKWPGRQIVLDGEYWCYSMTTSKHRCEFLGEGIAETRKKIKSGEYALADLNSANDSAFVFSPVELDSVIAALRLKEYVDAYGELPPMGPISSLASEHGEMLSPDQIVNLVMRLNCGKE